MRRLFALLTGLCLTLAGCNDAYDDSELVKRMDDFEQRLAKLERLCNDMNTNLGSMQTIVTALDNGDYITSVEPLTENGAVVGYTLKFAKGKPIVIYNGKSGTAPVIAVRKDADGIYYWTLDGEWLTGDDGKKLPVSGDAVAPKLRIEEDYWYISYDDGATWTQLGKASGEDGKDAAGIEIDMDENYVYFTLPGGQTVTVPRVGGGDTPAPAVPHILYAAGQELVPGKDYFYATIWRDGKRFPLSDGSADAFCNAVCTAGRDVYVVGCEAIGDLVDDGYYEPYHQNVAVLWHFKTGDEANAVRTSLSSGEYATSPIAVAASNGNVYAAGFESPAVDRRAVWWKNGQMEYLSDGSTDARAYCILADGDDVYVGGYLQPADNKRGGIARIWKNGTPQDLTDGSTLAKVNALCMDNGVLYAAGAEKTTDGRWKGVLWRDGQPDLLHRRGRHRSDGAARRERRLHHRRQHDRPVGRHTRLHLDQRWGAGGLRGAVAVSGRRPGRCGKRPLCRRQRNGRIRLHHLRGDQPRLRLEERRSAEPRNDQSQQLLAVGNRLRIRRGTGVTRTGRFGRTPTTNRASRHGNRTETLVFHRSVTRCV